MARRVPTILLMLAIGAACAPAEAVEAPRAAIATSTAAPTAAPPVRSPSPTVRPSPSAVPPPPVETPTPRPSVARSPEPVNEPSARLSVNLAKAADFVPQYTFEWCVGASLQMTRSIISDNRNETRRSQRRLWAMARDRSPSKYGGANPIGWAATLNDMGLGPYRFVSRPTFGDAVLTAARALVETRRPVGLVMWAGRHAWVMTGFESTGDPRRDDGARVTRVRVMDPLYPHGSRWGPSPAPNRLVRLETLARQFVVRNRPDYDLGVEPGWLLVLPVD